MTECSTPFKINIYFKYISTSLADCIKRKKSLLSSYSNQHKSLKPVTKLYDYEAIDKLNHQDRKLISIYYQEVEILRMIDHIIGALYFLNHFKNNHEAVCPQHIVVDEEGKFILADSQIFRI